MSLASIEPEGGEVVEVSFAERAVEANRCHHLAEAGLRSFAENARAAGLALLPVWESLHPSEWDGWIASNCEFSITAAKLYVRSAFYQNEVQESGAQTQRDVMAAVRGLPPLRFKPLKQLPELVVKSIERRKSSGESWRSIGLTLGMRGYEVRALVDPKYGAEKRKKDRAKSKRWEMRQATQKKALERQERAEQARKAGGDIAKAYGSVRRLLLELDDAINQAGSVEAKQRFHEARSAAHKCEDAIAAGLRANP